jgi:hypothetical protein
MAQPAALCAHAEALDELLVGRVAVVQQLERARPSS